MIYITFVENEYSLDLSVNSVWEVKENDVENKYNEFMQEKANNLNIAINPKWLNIMNYENHNNHLTLAGYENKKREWQEILNEWNIDKFIAEKLNGKRQEYKIIYK